jgi:hypothetical protein
MAQAQPAARLAASPDEQLNVRIPSVLSDKLDRMIRAIDEHGGGRTARKELIAAMLHATTDDAATLMEILARYRRAKTKDVVRSRQRSD